MNLEVYQERLKDAARRAGFSLSIYGSVGEHSLPVLERDSDTDKPAIYVAAGVHGDEPAGPMAVLDLLRRRRFPDNFRYVIFPLVNPTGLMAGTRENAEGIDLNRDYGLEPRSRETRAQQAWIADRQFDLVLCLHEDDEGTGFYIYEHIRGEPGQDYSGLALEAARPWTGIDSREEIDEMPARDGRMFPPMSRFNNSRNDLPEALHLHFHHGSRLTFTTETPGGFPVADRIAAQCAVVEAILAAFSRDAGQK